MKKANAVLVLLAIISLNTQLIRGDDIPNIKDGMGFYQIDSVSFRLRGNGHHPRDRKSATNRLWYAFFKAEEDFENKPLFVFLNGGPGCGTSMNLFAMNTAPYTLDRSRVADGELSAKNEYSWTDLGNLLYIDAPNTGFSYMVSTTSDLEDRDFRVGEFIFGDNYNSFIDAAQVLRVLLTFLADNPTLRANEVILVGESYSGVRVTTMLNLLLFYQQYAAEERVYVDKELTNLIENHFEATTGNPPPFKPEDIAKQFKRQVLIQPQIVDKYQAEDKERAFLKKDSLLDRLGEEARADKSWRDFLKESKKDGTSVGTAITQYLILIDRDQYNCGKNWEWSDDNEYFAMEALNDFNELSKITGDTDLAKVDYLLPENRKNALRFAMNSQIPIYSSQILNMLISKLPDDVNMFISLIPFWQKNLLDMDNPIGKLENKLGELNDFDSYIVGTNPYIFLGFYMNAGGDNLIEALLEMKWDKFDISPSDSCVYGTMFLENLALVDTFMTDAAYDIVVYAPTLVSQFKKRDFRSLIGKIEVAEGTMSNRTGSFTVSYKNNAIEELENQPKERTVQWYYYGDSGHSVTSSQPKEFRDDVQGWLSQ